MNLIKLILYLKSKYNLFFYSRNDYLNFFFKLLNKFFAKKQEQLTVLISLNSEFLFLTKDNLLNKKYLLFPINLHNFFNKKGLKSFLQAALLNIKEILLLSIDHLPHPDPKSNIFKFFFFLFR